MALDEPTPQDVRVEEEGILFLFDPKAATLIGDLVIDYDDGPGFTLYDESLGGGPSNADC